MAYRKFGECRTLAYQCSANVWTIGVGHTKLVKSNTELSNQDIAIHFVNDISSAETIVNDTQHCLKNSIKTTSPTRTISFYKYTTL
ncbi:glycoside hydrolase family protein [Aliivibrio fischeri]|uniref:glycoside hydrolase family protein n=1 Tax=Aliivibrio fischeri TaxID=668 RepID=UPI0039B77FD3